MQFLDGNRIDLGFCDVKEIDKRTKDSLTKVLLDKDHRVSKLPPPSERSYLTEKPTEKMYDDCCDEFIFGLGSHIPKTIWRKELPLLKVYIEVVLRKPLVKMFEWEFGVKTDFKKSIGKSGKHLQKYLEPATWQEYEQTYTDSNYDDIWKSLFVFYRLFKESAEFVGQEYGFQFPEEKGMRALSFLEHVRDLPEDARSIY
jgi:aminoglycoside 6-adenylyltransferase